mmetsp:Transcript_20360/g.18030  ORF Transcript_20360/g.18030 Transcript_20360/m.18030 type:complete len:96 (+) Transcript_20360:1232-1519(+)
MILFTLLLLFLRTNTSEGYYSVVVIRQMFVEDFQAKTDMAGIFEFLDLVGSQLLAKNVTDSSGTITGVEIPQMRGLSIVVKPIRLREQRTKPKSN